jgi:hypothetical protein
MKRRTTLLVLALPHLTSAREQAVIFAGGKVEVDLPTNMRVVSNEKQSLAAVFGPEEDHKIELTFHETLQSVNAADAAEQFVREQGQKKGRRVQQLLDKALFMEPGGEFSHEGKSFRSLHVQVGFGKTLIVVTLSAPHPMSPALNQFLGGPLNAMLSSLRRRDAYPSSKGR